MKRAEIIESRRMASGRRISLVEGFIQTAGISLGGIFAPNFVLTGLLLTGLNANNLLIGFVTAIPFLVGLLQPLTNIASHRVKSRTFMVGVFAFGGRLLFISAVFAGVFAAPEQRTILFIVLMSISAVVMSFSVTPWGAWMADIVPERTRGSYFAVRNALTSAAAIGGSLAAGYILTHLKGNAGFTLIYALCIVTAAVGFILILVQYEPKPKDGGAYVPLAAYRTLFGDKNFIAFTGIVVFVNFSLLIAGPFYAVHFLEHLRIPYHTFGVLSAAAAACGILGYLFFGKLSDIIGNRMVMKITLAMLVIPAVLCIIAPRANYFPFVLAALLVSAFFNTGLSLAAFNASLIVSPSEKRTLYLGVYTAITSLAAIGAPVIGGLLIDIFKAHPMPMLGFLPPTALIFGISAVCIVIALIVFPYYREGEHTADVPVAEMFRPEFAGSLYRLFLASFLPYFPSRKKLADDIGGAESPMAVSTLARLLCDMDLEVRRAAIEGLARTKSTDARTMLFAHYKDACIIERCDIVRGMRYFPGIDTERFLMDNLESDDAVVRAEAAHALAATGGSMSRDTAFSRLQKERTPELIILYLEILARYGMLDALPIALKRYASMTSAVARNDMLYQIARLLGIRDDFYAFAGLGTEEERLNKLITYVHRLFQLLRRQDTVSSDAALKADVNVLERELSAFVRDSAANTLRPFRLKLNAIIARAVHSPNRVIGEFVDYFLSRQKINNTETALLLLEINRYLSIRARIQ
ncbi:MAG: MFS transporter [Spirochaetota bacterium]